MQVARPGGEEVADDGREVLVHRPGRLRGAGPHNRDCPPTRLITSELWHNALSEHQMALITAGCVSLARGRHDQLEPADPDGGGECAQHNVCSLLPAFHCAFTVPIALFSPPAARQRTLFATPFAVCDTTFHRLSPPFTAFHRGAAVCASQAEINKSLLALKECIRAMDLG